MAIVPDANAGMRARVKGATVLQLRDPGASVRTLEREARRLIPTATVPVIISSRIDVARLAETFGGGGHRLASGATLPDPLDEARTRVLAAVAAALDAPT